MIEGASILVTGGSGSFGTAFIKRAIKENPDRLVVFSRDEQKQDALANEIQHPSLRWFVGDVRDLQRLEMAMNGIDIVVHAAAMKIIPKCESDPIECIRTNVGGAENVIRAAIRQKVGKVVALSTDKAAAPCNLYGSTKLCAEKLFIAAKSLVGDVSPAFILVRYGNVVGSRGSVIPVFQRLAAEGKALPITDLRMTRFWITLDQAVDFVLSSLKMMKGGEVFIPKIPSLKIVDLAKAIWGQYQQGSAPVDIVGIRPGEKLHETLLTADEARQTTQLSSRFIIDGIGGGLPEGYSYTSDNNTEWLSSDDVRKML